MVTKKSNNPSKVARFVIYPLLAILFVILAFFILALANGYWPKVENGKVEFVRTGMLIVASRPSGGEIYLDDKNTNTSTGFYLFPNKFSNLLPGNINVQIKKSGYRVWQKSLEILPGIVTWANYVLLFPEQLKTDKLPTTPGGNVIAKSENGRQLLYNSSSATVAKIVSYDTDNNQARSFWPTNSTNLAAWLKNPQIVSASYNQNNDRVLYIIKNGNIQEFVTAESLNNDIKLTVINDQLGINPASARWSSVDASQIYLTKDSNLYLVTNTTRSLPSSLVGGLVSFSVENNRQIYYVAKDNNGARILSQMNLDGTNKQTISQSIAASASYKFAHTADQNILALLNVDAKDLFLYYPGNGGKMTTLNLANGILGMSWSKNDQKLLYWGKDVLYRYDSEKKKETFSSVGQNIQSVSWFFDDCHFLVSSGKDLFVVDYDGTNRVDITTSLLSTYSIDSANANITYGVKSNGITSYTKYIAEF